MTLHALLQSVTPAPSTWQVITLLSAVTGLFAMFVTLGVVWGKLSARIDALDKMLTNTQRDSAKHSEMLVMFEDIKRRLERIEDHFDRNKS